MPLFPMPAATPPSLGQLVLVFLLGALLVLGVSSLVGAVLAAGLERRGQRLDRWRRVWFHPERELRSLLEAFLIVAFVAAFVRRYELPVWATAALAGLWALHLPADLWNWLRTRPHPRGTRELHERGFLLLDLGPLWLRITIAGFGAGLYFLLPPVRAVFDKIFGFVLASLHGWLS